MVYDHLQIWSNPTGLDNFWPRFSTLHHCQVLSNLNIHLAWTAGFHHIYCLVLRPNHHPSERRWGFDGVLLFSLPVSGKEAKSFPYEARAPSPFSSPLFFKGENDFPLSFKREGKKKKMTLDAETQASALSSLGSNQLQFSFCIFAVSLLEKCPRNKLGSFTERNLKNSLEFALLESNSTLYGHSSRL